MLHVHFSNRYEVLSRLLLEQLAGTRDNVFASDQVIVPSTAVRRALTLQIADREGVCANVQFVYLAKLAVAAGRARGGWRADGVAVRSAGAHLARLCAFGDDDFVTQHPRLAAYLQRAGADW